MFRELLIAERKFYLRRQNLITNEILYGTIGIEKEEIAIEVCQRNNRDDGLGTADSYYWWYESL